MGTKEEIFAGIKKAIIEGKAQDSLNYANEMLAQGIDPSESLKEMTGAMTVVGELFEQKKYFLPHVLTSAAAFEKAFALIQPKLLESNAGKAASGVVVLGVCEGDIHDIGKKIVCAMLRAAGFTVHDLGRDVPNTDFISKTKEVNANLIGMSALMSTSIREIKDFMDLAKEDGLKARVKVMCGGGSVTPEFVASVGAEGYGRDGPDAVRVAEELTKP